jgi:hypothetical protein
VHVLGLPGSDPASLSHTYTHTRIPITIVCFERHTVQQRIRNFSNAQLSYRTSCCVCMLVCGGAPARGNMFETHIACIASRGDSLLAAVSRRALVSRGIRWSGPWRGTALRAASGPYKISTAFPSSPTCACVCVYVCVCVCFVSGGGAQGGACAHARERACGGTGGPTDMRGCTHDATNSKELRVVRSTDTMIVYYAI